MSDKLFSSKYGMLYSITGILILLSLYNSEFMPSGSLVMMIVYILFCCFLSNFVAAQNDKSALKIGSSQVFTLAIIAPIIYMVSAAVIQFWMPEFFEIYISKMSFLVDMASYLVPAIQKSSSDLVSLNMSVRALEISHYYAFSFFWSITISFVLFGYCVSQSDLDRKMIDSGKQFIPGEELELHLSGIICFIVVVSVLFSVSMIDVKCTFACTPFRKYNFPFFYVLPIVGVLVGPILGLYYRQTLIQEYQNARKENLGND